MSTTTEPALTLTCRSVRPPRQPPVRSVPRRSAVIAAASRDGAKICLVSEPGERIVLADREHRFAPPPWRMFDALVTEHEKWLRLRPREVSPDVEEQERPHHVIWTSLWPISPDDRIEFYVRPDGAGSAVRFVWCSRRPPDEKGIGLVRHHLNEMIAGDLRRWVGSEVPIGE